MLYLIATPIGNLDDITLRSLKILEACDYLLCEDTRRTQKLLNHFSIKKKTFCYHKFNEASKLGKIVENLKEGATIGLLSDAGTPTIADPGVRLVKACHENNIPISSLPGPCAAIVALSMSGFESVPFQFVGFLEKKKGKLTKQLSELIGYPGTSICYESPYRLLKTIAILKDLAPSCQLGVARELTKKFEEIFLGNPEECLERWSKSPPKGEIILIVDGR